MHVLINFRVLFVVVVVNLVFVSLIYRVPAGETKMDRGKDFLTPLDLQMQIFVSIC